MRRTVRATCRAGATALVEGMASASFSSSTRRWANCDAEMATRRAALGLRRRRGTFGSLVTGTET